MTYPYIDTSVLIRLLTGDDPQKQHRSVALFEQVERGDSIVSAPDTVIADAVYVLSSKRLYNRSRAEIGALLTPLVRLPGFRIKSRRAVQAALTLYAGTPHLDFGDALIIASMRQAGAGVVYAYDTDFDDFVGVSRKEP